MHYASGQDETGLMKHRYTCYIPNHRLLVMFGQTVLNPQVWSDLSAGVWWHFYSLFVVFTVQTTCSLAQRWWLLSVLWKERWCALIWRDKRGVESVGTGRLNRDERVPLENRSGIRHTKPVFTFTLRLDRVFDLDVLYSLEFMVCWSGGLSRLSYYEKERRWFQTWVSLKIFLIYQKLWIWSLFSTPKKYVSKYYGITINCINTLIFHTHTFF